MGLPKTLPSLPIPVTSEDTVTFRLTKETLLMALRELGFELPDDTEVICERGMANDRFELTDHGHIEVSYTVIEETTPLRLLSVDDVNDMLHSEINKTLEGEGRHVFTPRVLKLPLHDEGSL